MSRKKDWLFHAALLLGVGAVAVPSIAQAKSARNHLATIPQRAKITTTRAEAVVLKKFGGKIVGHTALENEEGKWQYGVMVRSGHTLREVMVGAYSGRIEDVEVTDEAKEAREKKAEAAHARARHSQAATSAAPHAGKGIRKESDEHQAPDGKGADKEDDEKN